MIAATAWAAAVATIFVVSFFLFRDEWRAIFRALASLLNKTKKVGLTGIEAQENPAPPSPEDKRAAEEFFRGLDNPMLRELEDSIRADLDRRRLTAHDDREKALVKSLALSQAAFVFERIHNSLWASQFALLTYVNEHPTGASEQDVQRFYDAAKSAYPDVYEHYPRSSWFGFLQSYLLVTPAGENFVISIRGRAFLQFIVATGKRTPTFG